MLPLEKTLRNQLERTVKEAREVSETAARAALEQIGVTEPTPFRHLSDSEKALRRRLRAHGRQLGDALNGGKEQTMERLVEEVAYEHWHRMLFARFLAENNLLMYPDPDNPVPVTLEECEELAADEGAANGWELAARFAARMLPQIFRIDSPVFQLVLPPEHQQKLEHLLADLAQEVFTASDSLGWVYQFWQTKRKDEVNASEVKIGARELPAVTQLFTEPYMVSFLLDNSLGAWWAARRLTEEDLKNAGSEEELRKKAAIPGVPLEYLRFTSPLNPLSMNGEGTLRGGSVTAHNFVTPEKLEMARQFRKEPTPKEAEVWEWLRGRKMLGLKWRRQQVIEGFIADFYCAEHHLALEIDGDVHNSDQAREYDRIRDQIFARKAIRTIRIPNNNCTHHNLQHLIAQAITSNKPFTTEPISPSPFMERGPGGEVEVGGWAPAAGSFDAWPENLSDLKTLDPCCGSGHFLVAAFLMLVPMRMELEGLTFQQAVDAVLRENIHGLELDQRCVELAAFALALAAWKYPGAGGYRILPELNVACSGLSVSVAKEEWKQLGLGKKALTIALDWMHDIFKDAPILGSLLDPTKTDAAKLVEWDELSAALEQALKKEQTEEQQEVAVVAHGLAKAATLLAGRYQWVITNVPYLARGKQHERLREFCVMHYPAAQNDLATVFLDRCVEICVEEGTISIVLPQNWLFQPSYRKFRKKLLQKNIYHFIARLGPGAFETISGEVVKAILICMSGGNSYSQVDKLFDKEKQDNLIRGFDVSEIITASGKAAQLVVTDIKSVGQAKQLENPDSIVSIEELESIDLLSKFARAWQGIVTSDDNRYFARFWEIIFPNEVWEDAQQAPMINEFYTGKSDVIRWEQGIGALHTQSKAHNFPPKSTIGKWGIAIQRMSGLSISLFDGVVFDDSVSPLIPYDENFLSILWCYCHSDIYAEEVRKINQAVKVVPGSLTKVPFDLVHWTGVASEKFPNGLPKPFSNDPIQRIYHGHPCGSVVWDEDSKWTSHGPLRQDDTVLHVAVTRLLGYRWPAELDTDMELADEQREWVNRCEALLPYADEDGIVCIPSLRGEASAADRLLNLLAAAYGDAWSNDILANLLKNADHAGKTLETWLREKFFTQHCKLFQHRPFIWHIWDGLRDGFAALVNYHKLDAKLLESLIYTYLGDWISRQKQDINNGVDGAQERLAAAESLKKKLELILKGEEPYDIFVRWKPIEQQPIGWSPDLNDGVRLNIRPFMTVPDIGKKGAGVLRDKPNIKWNKDRGKDVESAPWYHLFKGDRINDHHLTLAEKRAAREEDHVK